MTHTRRSPGDDSRATSKTVSQTSLIMTRPGDGIRARRLRKFARRHLDEIIGKTDPWIMSDPTDWHAIHMDLGVPERDALGRSLAAVSP